MANLAALDDGKPEQGQARSTRITTLLAHRAGKDSVALVSQRPNIGALELALVEEGEAIVARIQPNGELGVAARVRP